MIKKKIFRNRMQTIGMKIRTTCRRIISSWLSGRGGKDLLLKSTTRIP